MVLKGWTAANPNPSGTSVGGGSAGAGTAPGLSQALEAAQTL